MQDQGLEARRIGRSEPQHVEQLQGPRRVSASAASDHATQLIHRRGALALKMASESRGQSGAPSR